MARKQTKKEKQGIATRTGEAERGRKSGMIPRKPSAKRGPPRKSAKSSNPVLRYFQDTREELRKVAWPTRKQTIRLTLIVLGTTLVFALFLGFLDLLFQQLAALLV